MPRGAFQIANQALKQTDQCLDLVVAHARKRQFIAGINGLCVPKTISVLAT
jgi:hypothetical protein